jgi:hypothetical protein
MGLETIILYGRFPELMRELKDANPHLHIDVVEMPAEKQIPGAISTTSTRTRPSRVQGPSW